MYLRWSGASKPTANGRRRALCQNRISHKLAKPKTISSAIRSLLITRRRIDQFAPIPRERAITPNNSQSGQTLVRAVSVRSLLSIGLPGPGSLGAAAKFARRQAEPAQEAVQLVSLRIES